MQRETSGMVSAEVGGCTNLNNWVITLLLVVVYDLVSTSPQLWCKLVADSYTTQHSLSRLGLGVKHDFHSFAVLRKEVIAVKAGLGL